MNYRPQGVRILLTFLLADGIDNPLRGHPRLYDGRADCQDTAMKQNIIRFALAATFCTAASAQTTFDAFLNGLGETPPNTSPGTGFGTVVLNAAQTQITVDLSWSGLTAPATALHIHGPGGAGTNAAVIFPFSGVPAATAGSIPEQTFAITPTQVGYLFSGYLYMNVHDANFPGGEIRGQLLLVSEPSTLALAGVGLAGIAWHCCRRPR